MYQFGPFELDSNTMELRRHQRPVRIQPKVAEFLEYLLRRAGSVVSRKELLGALWPAHSGGEDALNTTVRSLRKVLETDGQRYILTVRGVGYRFDGPVRARGVPRALHPVHQERHRLFVGRRQELEWFSHALQNDDPVRLVYVHGAGGIGKTSLLQQWMHIAYEQHFRVVELPSWHKSPSPEGLWQAIAHACQCPIEDILGELHRSGPGIIFADGQDAMLPLRDWLQSFFWGALPSQWRLVWAARNSPPTRWQTDPAWQRLARAFNLQELNHHDSLLLLSKRRVPKDEAEAISRFARGHPLGLVLAGDCVAQGGLAMPQAVADATSVFAGLVECFTEHVPGPEHRQALEAAALVDVLNESLLAAMLRDERVSHLFDWLATGSMVRRTTEGLVLHDLAKASLLADLRWRNPQRLASMLHRAYGWYMDELQRASSLLSRHRMVAAAGELLKVHPGIERFMALAPGPSPTPHPAQPEHWRLILDWIRRYEGEEAAAIAERWYARDPRATRVLCSHDGQPLGFLTLLLLRADDASIMWDPAVAKAAQLLAHRGQSSTQFTYLRFFADGAVHQRASSVTLACQMTGAFEHLTKPTLDPPLSWSFVATSQPRVWRPMGEFSDFAEIPKAAFQQGRLNFTVFGHDWSKFSSRSWAMRCIEQATAALEHPQWRAGKGVLGS